MQAINAAYLDIRGTPGSRVEYRLTIGGVQYGQGRVVGTPRISGALYAGKGPGIGGTVAREINLQVRPDGIIPRMAEIRVWYRLVSPAGEETEWYPKGVFYIATRQTDRVTGIVTIHGYDAMLKGEQPYLLEGDPGEWPRPMSEAAQEIAAAMGVSLDAQTASNLNSGYYVGYPNEMTMRDVLGYIAAAHGGNWTITDSGELRLVSLTAAKKDLGYLINEDGCVITFGDVRIVV